MPVHSLELDPGGEGQLLCGDLCGTVKLTRAGPGHVRRGFSGGPSATMRRRDDDGDAIRELLRFSM